MNENINKKDLKETLTSLEDKYKDHKSKVVKTSALINIILTGAMGLIISENVIDPLVNKYITGNTFQATVFNNYSYNDFRNNIYSDNQKALEKLNEKYFFQTIDFLNKKEEGTLNLFEQKLRSDLEHYKNFGFLNVDTYNSLIIKPNLYEDVDAKDIKNDAEIYGSSYLNLLGKIFDTFSYDKQSSSIRSSSITTFLPNKKTHDIKNIDNFRALSNCGINISIDKSGRTLYFSNDFIKDDDLREIFTKEQDLSKLIFETNETELEKLLTMELVFLHEYAHCLIGKGINLKEFLGNMFGKNNSDSIYLANNLNPYINQQRDQNFNSTIKTYLDMRNSDSILRATEERFVDLFAATVLLNRYANADDKTLLELNNVFSKLKLIRLENNIYLPNVSHSGYEIFDYLNQPSVIKEVKNLKNEQELFLFLNKTMEKNNQWRLNHNLHVYLDNFSFSKILGKYEAMLCTPVLQDSIKNKEDLDKYFSLDLHNENSIYQDLHNILKDFIFEKIKEDGNDFTDKHILDIKKNKTPWFILDFYEKNLLSEEMKGLQLDNYLDYISKETSLTHLSKKEKETLLELVKLNISLNQKLDNLISENLLFLDDFEDSVNNFGEYYISDIYFNKNKSKTLTYKSSNRAVPIFIENFMESAKLFEQTKNSDLRREFAFPVRYNTKEETNDFKEAIGTNYEYLNLDEPTVIKINLKIDDKIKLINKSKNIEKESKKINKL